MATKAPLGVLIGEGQRENELIDEIKGSYAKLRESLDARQNQLFDPVLLAMAQGFLSPTKTGSFGEVLGNVAERVGPAQEAQNKREQEMAAMRMELAQKELGQLQATRGLQAFQDLVGGKAPATLGGAAPAATQYAGKPGEPAMPAVSGMPQMAPQAGGAQAAQAAPAAAKNKLDQMSEADILALAANPAMAPYLPAIKDYLEARRKNQELALRGREVAAKEAEVARGGQKVEPVMTIWGQAFPMTLDEAQKYRGFIAAKDIPGAKKFLESITGRVLSDVPGGARTTGEVAASQAAQEAQAKKQGENEGNRVDELEGSIKKSTDMINELYGLRKLVEKPSSSAYLGIFNKPGIGNAFLGLVKEGLMGDALRSRVTEMVARNSNIPKEYINDMYSFLQAMGSLNLAIRKDTRTQGEGSMSDYETRLSQAAGLTDNTTPEGVLRQIAFLEARAKNQREVARGWEEYKSKNPSKKTKDYFTSSEYESISRKYADDLARAFKADVERRGEEMPVYGGAGSSASPSKPLTQAQRELNESVGLR